MGVTGSPFCEHKKLRTSCAVCKPTALPADATLRATPFVTEEEREKKEARRATRAPGERTEPSSASGEAKPLRGTGPGKPLLPQRKRTNRNITAAEADSVKPWWVKK
jgi:hypothetical protein